MDDTLSSGWRSALAATLATPQTRHVRDFLLAEERAGKRIFTPSDQRFAALEMTPLDAVKVVILGQDPYHGEGQANGLAFSVAKGVRIPPSLRNIFKEREADLGIPPSSHGDLSDWARRGVLLLNNALSVEEGKAGSHRNIGWEPITDAIVAAVAARPNPCVFLLWGAHAQKKASRILGGSDSRHLTLHAAHPSPLSAHAGFFGCRHFSRANSFLDNMGCETIDWKTQ